MCIKMIGLTVCQIRYDLTSLKWLSRNRWFVWPHHDLKFFTHRKVYDVARWHMRACMQQTIIGAYKI